MAGVPVEVLMGDIHHQVLRQVGNIWQIPYAPHVPTPDDVETSVQAQLSSAAAGKTLPWAIVRQENGRVAGQTTYLNIALSDRGLEIGSTYLARSAQRTGINTEMKLLLLEHAFETLACLRVEFRVHHLNLDSRRAVERLGAQQDGVLRAHRILPDGTVRHTVVYSILAPEWPGVRAALKHRLHSR